MSDASKSIRWWPFITIIALVALALLIIWIPDSANRQIQVMSTMAVAILGFLFTLIWFFAGSRLTGKIRIRGLAAFVILLGLVASLFEIRGFTGDLVPNIAWRWTSQSYVSENVPNTLNLRTNYPQFLGPNRNATLPNIQLQPDWEQHPPKLLWRKAIGDGWSAFAVSDRFAVTQEQQGEQETVVCYDLLTGQEQWRYKDTFRYENPMAGIGPRATPTISTNRVYTLGASGILNCLDLQTGQKIWSRNTLQDAQANIQEWGQSGSPLILGEKVIVSPGGANNQSLVAYHKDTGNMVWGGGSQKAGNSSPSLTRILDTDQILIFNRKQIASHHPETGQMLWEHPWPGGTQHVAQPVPLPEARIFASTGYGVGAQLIQITKDTQGIFSAETLWKNNRLKAKFTNVVHKDGYIYGLDDGILVCLDVETGKRKWKRGRYGHGQLILIDEILLIQSEHGDVVLVDATPKGHNERATLPALSSRTWNNPTFAAPYLLVRNDREAACYELALK